MTLKELEFENKILKRELSDAREEARVARENEETNEAFYHEAEGQNEDLQYENDKQYIEIQDLRKKIKELEGAK